MYQLIQEHPDTSEKFMNSDQCFEGFCFCFKMSLRLETHTVQETTAEVESIFQELHKHLL